MNARIKVLCYLLIAFLSLRYLCLVAVTSYKGLGGDFDIYKKHAYILTELKKDSPDKEIYAQLTKVSYLTYFPLFYLALLPLFKLGDTFATAFWILLNQAAFILAIGLILKTVRPKFTLVELTLAFFVCVNFLPVEHNIIGGQTNFLVLLSLSGCLYFLEHKKDIFAGISLVPAIILKLTPIIFLAFLFWKKKYLAFWSCFLSLVLMYSVSISLLGFKLHYIQLFRVVPDSALMRQGFINNHSIASIFNRLFRLDLTDSRGIFHLPQLSGIIGWVLVFVFFGLTFKRLSEIGRETKDGLIFEFSFFLSLLYLLPVFIMLYHWVWALIPFLVIFLNPKKAKKWIWVFIVSFILLGAPYWPDGLPAFRKGWGLLALSGRPVGAILLWLGFFLALSPKAKTNGN